MEDTSHLCNRLIFSLILCLRKFCISEKVHVACDPILTMYSRNHYEVLPEHINKCTMPHKMKTYSKQGENEIKQAGMGV